MRAAITGVGTAVLLLVLGAPVTASDTHTVTKTFSYTGTEQTWIVPPGLTSVHVEAIGGKGASGADNAANTSTGGFGAHAEGDLTVADGEVLYLDVGGNNT